MAKKRVPGTLDAEEEEEEEDDESGGSMVVGILSCRTLYYTVETLYYT
jgi:hypothetical protein